LTQKQFNVLVPVEHATKYLFTLLMMTFDTGMVTQLCHTPIGVHLMTHDIQWYIPGVLLKSSVLLEQEHIFI